jgi:hypothetical protein
MTYDFKRKNRDSPHRIARESNQDGQRPLVSDEIFRSYKDRRTLSSPTFTAHPAQPLVAPALRNAANRLPRLSLA